MMSIKERFSKACLFEPVDIAILVYFRIIFGAIMFWDVIRYVGHDWVTRYYVTTKFTFTYYGFDWIQP